MAYSLFMLALGCALPFLGFGIAIYLLKLYLESSVGVKRGGEHEPEYVREINNRLTCNNVETERDLF